MYYQKDRVRLNIETYEGLAIIKSHIKAAGKTASELVVSPALRSLCLSSYNRYQSHLKRKKGKINKEEETEETCKYLLKDTREKSK